MSNQNKSKSIIFNSEMVNAILDGRKTQTRRVAKCRGDNNIIIPIFSEKHGKVEKFKNHILNEKSWDFCPFGKIGDRLWVRETWAVLGWMSDPVGIIDHPRGLRLTISYKSDDYTGRSYYPDSTNYQRIRSLVSSYKDEGRFRSPVTMPRWASRITLEITDIRVERLQEISIEDAKAEGIERLRSGRGYYDPTQSHAIVRLGHYAESAKEAFSWLWQSTKGKGSWNQNPFVFVITFRRIENDK